MSFKQEKDKNKQEKLSKKIEKGKSRKYKRFIDIFLLIGIVITAVNPVYITVPIFLTVVFILIQFKKYVDYKIKG